MADIAEETETTAFVPSQDSRIQEGSTIVIDGVEHPIPDAHSGGGFFAPLRILETLHKLGWQPATDYYGDIRQVPGGFEIRIKSRLAT